ncbi:hypothetical protein O6H91_Y376000 [Diphasiastrum complanatum]|nr:hypothetical protein O6H91_Y376000 [Diphasiastrum complanatum]
MFDISCMLSGSAGASTAYNNMCQHSGEDVVSEINEELIIWLPPVWINENMRDTFVVKQIHYTSRMKSLSFVLSWDHSRRTSHGYFDLCVVILNWMDFSMKGFC